MSHGILKRILLKGFCKSKFATTQGEYPQGYLQINRARFALYEIDFKERDSVEVYVRQRVRLQTPNLPSLVELSSPKI